MAILVLGGAGYIGSHMVDRLVAAGKEKVVVVDSLVTGHRAAVNPAAKFYQGDLADQDFMRGVFRENPDIDAVIHFAAFSLVAESMKEPLKYFDNNTAGMVKLLEVMKEFGVKKIVFSSTAATYGIPEKMPIREDDPQKPINPYGESKLMMEKIMRWCDQAYGIKFVALRYFNVAGAKPDGSIGEDHGPETHLPTAPTCATTCTPSIWPMRTSSPSTTCVPAMSPTPSTSVPPPASRTCRFLRQPAR